ncbi:FG-GAP-like repeat-containing protein [Reyranella soli]|uniref:Uncharacterized protein n=1 Tax=Reyranella soli TaxID=1230389 RepID=A0A512NPX6_9HYPH|nr:FG-GAP-like repeat-containing protein [Reyranella soli]GEP61008.1 hypothetical protein RSO01_81740 [Reyranella soli]
MRFTGQAFPRLFLLFALLVASGGTALSEVTDAGTYWTSVEVDVPSFHEITPVIRLDYDSNAGDGPLGIGWSLSVGSQITRTSKFRGAPRLDAKENDQLWLDGVELIPCADATLSASCQAGGTHTTRIETYTRIGLDEASNTWTLWRPNGTRLILSPKRGNTASPESTLRWLLTEVIDTHENRVRYDWICGFTNTCYLSDVAYGEGKICTPIPSRGPDDPGMPVGAPMPGANVHFFWEGRPDPVSIAIGGNPEANLPLEETIWRLRAIAVSEGGQLVNVHQINYLPELPGALGYKHSRSSVASIQVYGSDTVLDAGGNVLSGTASPERRFEAPSHLGVPLSSFMNIVAGNDQFLPTERAPPPSTLPAIYSSDYMESAPGIVSVTGTERNFMPRLPSPRVIVRTHQPGQPFAIETSSQQSITLGDLDGDRKLDVLHWSTSGTCDQISTRTVMGAGGGPSPRQDQVVPQANLCATRSFAADLDGDGRSDLVFLRYRRTDPLNSGNPAKAEIISALSNGNGTFTYSDPIDPIELWTSPTESIALQSQCGVGDINGDGRADFVCTVKGTGGWVVVVAVSTGFGKFDVKTDSGTNTLTDRHTLVIADANGDGRSDLLVVDERRVGSSSRLDVKVGISDGSGSFAWTPTQQTNLEPAGSGQTSRVLVGDFNADSRADLLLVIANDNGSGGSFTTFSSQVRTTDQFLVTQSAVRGEMPAVSVADYTGDGLDDLVFAIRERAGSCNSTLNYDHVSITIADSDGSGVFRIPSTFETGCYTPLNWPWIGNTVNDPFATYVNGDRIADLFQWLDGGALGFIFFDLPSDYRSRDLSRWRAVDVNGDGRLDWVFLNYANPGLTVLTQISQPDGTRRLIREDVPSSQTAPLRPELATPESASNWFLVDVGGGPGGAPDGKVDIVLIDDVSQQIVTLLSNGDGTWRKIVDPYTFSLMSDLRGTHVATPGGDIFNWYAIDVNGDGKTDLVHIAFRQTAQNAEAKIHVTTLPALGNGHWGPAIHGDYSFNGNLRHPSVRGFFPADVDGDGRMDLVRIEADPSPPGPFGNNATVFTLLSRSDGSWVDRYDPVVLPSLAARNWRPMDVNGDGRTDLASFRYGAAGELLVSHMLSLGNGRWQPVVNSPVTPRLVVNVSASQEFRVSDLDGDGKQDIVHLSKIGPYLATMVIWNRYPNFVQTVTPNVAPSLTDGDTTSWQLADFDSDGVPELVRVQPGTRDLNVITIPARSVRMTRASNGMGASEEITYGTLVEVDRDMPLGALPYVVKSVGVRSVDGGAYDSVTQFNYTRATWSYQKRRFLGFRHVERSDGTRILSSDLDLSDECGARRTTEELLNNQRRLIGRTTSVFAPTGFIVPPNVTATGDTHGHSLCRMDAVEREEWELAARPRRSVDRLVYDDYGNIREFVQDGDPADSNDDRRFTKSVNFNIRDFIVDRPAVQEVYGRTGGLWKLLSQIRYEYDGSGDYMRAPGPVGDISRIRRWNDKTGTYVNVNYKRDKQGNLREVTGPPIPSNSAGVTRTIEYDCELARFPEKICDSLHCAEIAWEKRLGLPAARIDANGGRTTFAYDALRRLLRLTRPDGSFDVWRWPTQAQWSTPAQAVRHERSDDSPRDGVLWDQTFFDGLGRTVRVEREGGVIEEIIAYDGASGRVRQEAAPRFAADARQVTTYDYDSAGRLFSMSRPDGSSRRVRYEVAQRTVTDELRATTSYQIDPFGRIVAVVENRRDCVAETCPVVETGVTSYGYDALDRLTGITDARNNSAKLGWDSLGRLEASCYPDGGCTSFAWNDDGTLAKEVRADESMRRISYDSIGRPGVQESFDATGNRTRRVQWTWDIDPGVGGPRGASQGRITQIEDNSSAAQLLSTYQYDPLGRVDLESSCIDGVCYEVGTRFDRAGRIGKITYPSANGRLAPSSLTVAYVYDDRGLLQSVPGFVDRFVHDARGRTTEITYANGIVELRPHDRLRGWSDGVSASQGRTRLLEQVVRRDLAGRVREEGLEDSRGTRREVYGHDDLGRLTMVTSSDPARNRTFTYDILGNLVRHSLLGSVTYGDTRHVHALTETQSGERFFYDRIGQLRESTRFEINWSTEGRPATIKNLATKEVSRYAYDLSGQRVKSELGGKVTLYPNRLVQIYQRGAIMPWVWAEGRPVAYLERANPHFLHADALGSVRLVTDRTGRVENEYDYGTWGEEARATGTGGSEYRYAGSRSDRPTGLAYMNARYYDPVTTRFISADPIIPNVYAPQTLNRYAYALNDPVSLTDSSGLAVDCTYPKDKDGNEWGADCYEPNRQPAQPKGGTPPPDDETVARDWRARERAQLREDVRQARELGPLRSQAPAPSADVGRVPSVEEAVDERLGQLLRIQNAERSTQYLQEVIDTKLNAMLTRTNVQLTIDEALGRQLRNLIYEQERFSVGALLEHAGELLDDPVRMERLKHYAEPTLWNTWHMTWTTRELVYGHHPIERPLGGSFMFRALQEQLHLYDEVIDETRGKARGHQEKGH